MLLFNNHVHFRKPRTFHVHFNTWPAIYLTLSVLSAGCLRILPAPVASVVAAAAAVFVVVVVVVLCLR